MSGPFIVLVSLAVDAVLLSIASPSGLMMVRWEEEDHVMEHSEKVFSFFGASSLCFRIAKQSDVIPLCCHRGLLSSMR